MNETRKVIKVFLASPRDLGEERMSAKAVVDEFNAQIGKTFGYHVELMGWEDTISGYGRPQAVINRDLVRCEFFVGIMWKRWGTPPDTTGTYSSGFEEEFESSVIRKTQEGRPEISLFFKQVDPELLRDPGKDLKKVLEFKGRLVAEKNIFFEEFLEVREFESKFRRCITAYVTNLWKEENNNDIAEPQAPKLISDPLSTDENDLNPSEAPFSTEGSRFLKDFILKLDQKTEIVPVPPPEIARFRLLAAIMGGQGNDSNIVGVHDANLLFVKRSDFAFEPRELEGLLVSGLHHFSTENVPFWFWLDAIGDIPNLLLPLYSYGLASTEIKTGALAAMKLISNPESSRSVVSRDIILASWFSDDAPNAVKIAALAYLADCGISEDTSTIKQELDRRDYQTASAAADAIIRITLRENREKAIEALYELQPTSIGDKVVKALFESDPPLETETLLIGLNDRNTSVRRTVVRLLSTRKALKYETAMKLLEDSDEVVRFYALKSLFDKGRQHSDKDARKILIKRDKSMQRGLLGLAAWNSEEICWLQYRLHCLQGLSDSELEQESSTDCLFRRNHQFVLAERKFNIYGNHLRECVDNRFEKELNQALAQVTEDTKDQGNLAEQLRSLENSIRKELTRRGLDVICRRFDIRDLERVRLALKSGFVDFSIYDIEYLKKFGGWEDVPLIIESLNRPESEFSKSVPSVFDESRYRIAARAIYALGRSKLNEVFSITAPSILISEFIAEIPNKAYSKLDDPSINLLLYSETDSVRKKAALKCVMALPKKRLSKLLINYLANEKPAFYNVVHWLDFGVTCSREVAIRASEKILNP